jgi:hypothetical protein
MSVLKPGHQAMSSPGTGGTPSANYLLAPEARVARGGTSRLRGRTHPSASERWRRRDT